jgi:drug/metabolite transporter (DMT)-like permease
MMMILPLFLVAICWGATNPFIKRGASGLSAITLQHASSTVLARTTAELLYLLRTPSYLIPLLINLSGSSVYYYTLGDSGIKNGHLNRIEVSIAVPVANGLTFGLTAITGILIGEDFGGTRAIFGAFLTIFGVLLCVIGK